MVELLGDYGPGIGCCASFWLRLVTDFTAGSVFFVLLAGAALVLQLMGCTSTPEPLQRCCAAGRMNQVRRCCKQGMLMIGFGSMQGLPCLPFQVKLSRLVVKHTQISMFTMSLLPTWTAHFKR